MSSDHCGRLASSAIIRSFCYALATLLAVACSEPMSPQDGRLDLEIESPHPPPPPPAPPPAPSGTGQTAFVASCASCHASRDGFDLAYFSYSDTNIVRRALKHVSSTTAWSIATYIATIPSPKVPENTLLFQPGGSVISGGTNATGDVNFALAAFGQNAWPASYTRNDVLAINPKTLRIALPLLPWSDETNTREWMPKDSLPLPILTFNGNAAANALAAYYANPTVAGLEAVSAAVNNASYNVANSIAPCQVAVISRTDFQQCFEIRRWVASLSVTHKLRTGIAFLSPALYLDWWNVGNIARLSRGYPGQVPDYLQQQARWMYLGWMHDVPNEPAKYGTDAFRTLGMPRHATWKALRSIVARAPGVFLENVSPYVDFKEIALSTPAGTAWSYNAGKFGLNELLRRLSSGDRPPTAALRTEAKDLINVGMSNLRPKVSASEFLSLTTLATAVLAKL
jgi:hypothetical protein